MRQMRRLLLLLPLLLMTQTACFARTDTRAMIQSQLKQADSVWAKALPAEFRGELSKYADAPVHRYHLAYDPNTRQLSGTAEILFTNTTDHPLPSLIMRTYAKFWGEGKASDFSLTDLKVNNKQAEFTMGRTLITVPLTQPLNPGKSVRVTYAATVTLPKLNTSGTGPTDTSTNLGFYGAGPDVTALGGFPALIPNGEEGKLYDTPPKNDFPELNTADVDEIWLTLPADWMVIPQGTLLEETPTKNGQKTAHIVCVSQISEPGGFVLISNKLTRRVAKAGDIEVRTYTDVVTNRFADAVMKEVQGALQTFQTVYGPVALPKLDVILMPVRAGGTLLGGGLIVVSDKYASDERGMVDMYLSRPARLIMAKDMTLMRHRAIYHEVSHAWWGDLVSSDTPAETWLEEAMAVASEIYASEQLDGADAGYTSRLNNISTYWKQRVAGVKDAPIGLPLPEYDNLQHRNLIAYNKGGLYFDELRKTVGDDKFFAAMRTYLKEHTFTVIHEPGPTAALLSEPGVEQLYNRWVKETHGDADIGRSEIHDKDFRAAVHLPAE